VLTASGGLLRNMLLPFRLGLGGQLGDGRQVMSWIALDDMLGVILHALYDDQLSGPLNAVSPAPATNQEFTRTLARVLRRPAVFGVPAPLLTALFGEMGRELFLSGARVRPSKLEATGYGFRHQTLEPALRWELGR
jgi:hypothetical protein